MDQDRCSIKRKLRGGGQVTVRGSGHCQGVRKLRYEELFGYYVATRDFLDLTNNTATLQGHKQSA